MNIERFNVHRAFGIEHRALIDDHKLQALVHAFRGASLPKSAWSHEAHLAVGAWHVHRFGPVRALSMLRAGIRRLNDHHGTPNTDARGYHETITHAYVCVIADVLAREAATSVIDGVRAVLASDVARTDALLEYFSRDRLMSIEARRAWVPPDLRHILPLHWPRPLTTPRLRLRCPAPADAGALARLMTPAVSAWLLTWKAPMATAQASERVEEALAAIDTADGLYYVVTARADDDVIGWVRVERTEPAGHRAELGFWFGEGFHGRGYATEAATAARDAAFRLLDVSTVEAGAQVGNTASLRVIEKLGMRPIGERLVFSPARQKYEPCLYFEQTDPEAVLSSDPVSITTRP